MAPDKTPSPHMRENYLPPHLRVVRTSDRHSLGNRRSPAEFFTKPKAELFALYRCSYEHCLYTSDNLKTVQRHKKDTHDYCRRCDIDFRSWEEFHLHKMESDRHIACPECGEEFRTSGGRERHVLLVVLAYERRGGGFCFADFPLGSSKTTEPSVSRLRYQIQAGLCHNQPYGEE
jgi:DNA-directed RNA polymerase subunit RPC12/RpoP